MLKIAMAINLLTASVGTSKIATGTQKLIQDATTWLLVIAPIAGTVAIIYFAIRRGMADEQEQKQWQNRIIVAIVSVIIAVLASVIINLVTSYYA
ncbi:hypothetical protein FACS1894208_12500 [Clostridia bacterium]|nr:hypothetical protein FACS1894208_12500 [Clostridia bacterium]